MLAAVLLIGCSAPPDPSPSPLPFDRLGQVRRTLAEIAAAVQTADRATFDQLVSLRDPTFESRARLLYTNLSTLPLAGIDFGVEPADHPVSPGRQRVLGPDAWTHRVVVTTSQLGEDGAAEHRVWLTFVVEDGRARLAGTVDGPADEPEERPIWWVGPVTSLVDGRVTAVAGAGQPAELWTELAGRAAGAVRAALPPEVGTDWDGRVSLEIPASLADFAAVLGQPPGRYDDIAAVTRPTGSAAQAPLRIVINPRAREIAGQDGTAELLRHEMVHLATRSPDSAGPLWAEEGLAEWVALGRTSPVRDPAAQALLAEVDRVGPPERLPADEAFAAGSPDVALAYAQAWLVCRYVAERYSAARLGRLYAELDEGRTLDQASRAALGIGAAELVAGWRRYLIRLARAA